VASILLKWALLFLHFTFVSVMSHDTHIHLLFICIAEDIGMSG